MANDVAAITHRLNVFSKLKTASQNIGKITPFVAK